MSSTEVTRLLHRWESRLRDLGAPSVHALRPGRTRRQVDELAAEYGLEVSDDAAALWMWHDGDTGTDVQHGLTPSGQFWSLEGSLERSIWLQHITCDGPDDGDYSDERPGDELYFRRDYLTILSAEYPLYVDCTPGTTGTER